MVGSQPPSSDYGSDIDFPESSDYGSDIDLDFANSNLLTLLNATENAPAQSPCPPLPTVKTSTRFSRNGALVIQYEELAYPPTPSSPTTASIASPEVTPKATNTLTPNPQPTIISDPQSATNSDSQPEIDPTTIDDPRSPYDRFRSRRGRLSVTDLISTLWCEQQFLYTLTKGMKRSTPAMRAGTALHKTLEEQIHTTIPVRVSTHEDAWGLRLFNICQGLLSLQEQGITRELEVFGWLDGVFITGIIDEISYSPPPCTDRFVTALSAPVVDRTAYIVDTKTRATSTVPGGSQMQSTALQLMFYHRLLEGFPEVDFGSVLAHQGLDGTVPFSDGFVAQVAAMESCISLEEMLENNCLEKLWGVVGRAYKRAIAQVGGTVGVCYLAQTDGSVIAERSWEVERDVWERHLQDVMMWWRGERMTKGVEVQEAWKCRSCDFQEGCTWRLGKLEEMMGRRGVKGKGKVRVGRGGRKVEVEVQA